MYTMLYKTDNLEISKSTKIGLWSQFTQQYRKHSIHNLYLLCHRASTKPAVLYPDGIKLFYINDLLHKVDGPAFVIDDLTSEYWVYGRLFESTRDHELEVKKYVLQN